jgi:hypothetical protein
MFSQEPAPLSGFIKFMTTFVFVMFAVMIVGFVFSIILLSNQEPSFAVFMAIFVVVFGGLAALTLWICYRQKPHMYKIVNGELIVERAKPWKDIHVSLSEIKSLEILPKISLFSLRVWGNGGLFCVSGTFYSFKLGKYRASVTSIRDLLLIRYGKKALVISPAEPVSFKLELERLMGLKSAS